MTREEFEFKAVVNGCMICHKPTNDPSPFYVCEKCNTKFDRCMELIDMYSDREKSLSAENLAEMFLNILKKKPVSIEYIFNMFDEMDKMGG